MRLCSGNVHGVSAHAGYGTADVPRLYELDDDTSKATGDIHGLKLAAFLSQVCVCLCVYSSSLM